jgi:ribosomal protein S26
VAEPGQAPEGVRDDGVTMACAHCGRLYPVSGRSRYCDNACKQRAYRARRKAPPVPTRLSRSPKEATVYYCEECDTRYLGVQYCESCNLFCRRLGAGGRCPCCDEPVAVNDLVEGVAIILSE